MKDDCVSVEDFSQKILIICSMLIFSGSNCFPIFGEYSATISTGCGSVPSDYPGLGSVRRLACPTARFAESRVERKYRDSRTGGTMTRMMRTVAAIGLASALFARTSPAQAASAAAITDRLGFGRSVLRDRVGLAPSCGLAGATETWARTAVELTQRAVDGIAMDPDSA